MRGMSSTSNLFFCTLDRPVFFLCFEPHQFYINAFRSVLKIFTFFNHFDYTAENISHVPPLQQPELSTQSNLNNNSQLSSKPNSIGTVTNQQANPPPNNFGNNNNNFGNQNSDPYLQNGLGYSSSQNNQIENDYYKVYINIRLNLHNLLTIL